MRRRIATCVIAFTVLTMVVLLSLWYAMRPTHRIDNTNIERLQQQMTLAEVEVILGASPGDYSTRRVVVSEGVNNLDLAGVKSRTWTSNDAFIRVYFDNTDRVIGFKGGHMSYLEESWWTSVRRWIRLD